MRGIKIARTIKGIKQIELAELMDVSLTTISAWETGKYKPTTDNLIKLSEVLDTNVNELVKY